MDQASFSITDVKALVEKLSRLSASLSAPAPEGPWSGSDLLTREVLDRPLVSWMEDFWPSAEGWDSRGICLEALNALERGQRRLKQELSQEVERRRRLLERAEERLEELRREPSRRENQARIRAARAEEMLRQLLEGAERCRRQAREKKTEAGRLADWLKGVEPQGLRGFKDAAGRIVSRERVSRVNDELAGLQRELLEEQKRSRQLEQGAELARRKLAAAEAELTAAQDRRRQASRELGPRAERVQRARDLLRKGRERLARAEREELNAIRLGRLYARLLAAASALAGRALDQNEPEEAADPARILDDSLEQASRAGRRCRRLGDILLKLDAVLARRDARVGEALARVRDVNRRIKRIEGGLPEHLAPLTNPESASAEARSRASAGLSMALAEVEELAPLARRAQEELEELRRALSLGLERGRRWRKQWRQAGKEQRSLLSQARALAAEADRTERDMQKRRAALIGSLEPLFEALAPLSPVDVLPLAALAVERTVALEKAAESARRRAAELARRLEPEEAFNLSRPPAALKPHSTALRRLSGRRVEMDRLQALAAAQDYWRELLSAPVEEAIKAPGRAVAERLTGSLSLMAAERARLARGRRRTAGVMSRLRSDLRGQRDRGDLFRRRLRDLSREHGRQRRELKEARTELTTARKDQALAWDLSERLMIADQALADMDQRLEHFEKLSRALKSRMLERHALLRLARRELEEMRPWREKALHAQRLSQALKAKMLERHAMLKQARGALDRAARWRRQAEHQTWVLERTRAELDQARFEASRAKELLKQANAEQDQSARDLARERAARARQALDLLEGKTMAVGLAAAQSEAGRWADLARELSAALALGGLARQKEAAELRGQVDRLSAEAAGLREQLKRISQMVALADLAAGGKEPAGPVGVRITPLDSSRVDQTLDRLASVRGRLRRIGNSTLGHWALIASLTAGLLLAAPGSPSKATLTAVPLETPSLAPRRAVVDLRAGPAYSLAARVSRPAPTMGRGRLDMNLLPLRATGRPLPRSVKKEVARLAEKAGLSSQVLLTSARALYAKQMAVEPSALEELARTARSLAKRHPLIFRELAGKGLPPSARDLAGADSAPEQAQHLFLDRLYREYRTLGFSAEESLGAIAANERAARDLAAEWRPPRVYSGSCRPVPALEKMNLPNFLARMTPYIQSKLKVFLRQRGMTFAGDLEHYAKNLAFDMYCAAKKFEVPVTFLLAIAHQETWYANVLGDANRSASPFQIYEPTRALIRLSLKKKGFTPPPKGLRLERHLTMATFMAAFHLRELMQDAYTPATRRKPARIDMDKVLLRYNGSSRYAGRVAKRQRALARFVKSQG